MVDFTLNPGTVHRWMLSFADRAGIQASYEIMAGRNQLSRARKDLDDTRIRRDEDAVRNVVSTIRAMTNLVTYREEHLVNHRFHHRFSCSRRQILERYWRQ